MLYLVRYLATRVQSIEWFDIFVIWIWMKTSDPALTTGFSALRVIEKGGDGD